MPPGLGRAEVYRSFCSWWPRRTVRQVDSDPGVAGLGCGDRRWQQTLRDLGRLPLGTGFPGDDSQALSPTRAGPRASSSQCQFARWLITSRRRTRVTGQKPNACDACARVPCRPTHAAPETAETLPRLLCQSSSGSNGASETQRYRRRYLYLVPPGRHRLPLWLRARAHFP